MLFKLVLGLSKTILVLFLVFGGFAAWAMYAETTAQAKAQTFCDTIKIGITTEGLHEKALTAGANRRQTRWTRGEEVDWLPVTFSGVTPFETYTCTIRSKRDIIISKEMKS